MSTRASASRTPSVSPTASTAPAAEPPVRFADLLAAEWIKVRSLRSTPWTIALTALFVVGSSAATTLAYAVPNSGPRHNFLPFHVYPPAGYWLLMVVAASAGALALVSEYGSGLIRTTTVAVPARGSVVLAKAVVAAALWAAVGAVVATGSFYVSQAILAGKDAGVSITHPGVPRAMAASALVAPVCALIGLGLAALIRHSAATMVTAVFTLVMLPLFFSESKRWSAAVNHATPGSAWKRLVQDWAPDPENLAYTATVPGSWAVYVVWPLVAVALAVVVVRRRDV
ncbi:ABC transporter permease [Streptomyces sp. NPDC051907]|uniref:ABC transporter permease n=1 Tax=Streptomyces sp. NPDC051907 TaxID=3155284 RepID=UPI0034158293